MSDDGFFGDSITVVDIDASNEDFVRRIGATGADGIRRALEKGSGRVRVPVRGRVRAFFRRFQDVFFRND